MATTNGAAADGRAAWSHVVRGESSEAGVALPAPEAASPDRAEEEQPSLELAAADRGRKPAWSKPAGGDAAVSAEAGPVMGAASWPALSKSAAARGSPKLSNDSSPVLKPVADGSVPASQGPVIAPTPKAVANNNNANPNSAHNNANPTRQKSMKRGDRGTDNGGPFPAHADGQIPEPSPKDTLHRANSWESGSRGGVTPQSHSNDQQRNSYRRGHNSHHSRGEFHDGHRNRRDQERGNYEWNDPRNFSGRDVHMQQPRPVPRNFMRPPPNSMPFIVPPRPFMNPMGYPPDIPPPFYYVPPPYPDAMRGFPFVPQPPPPPFFYPGFDPGLRSGILMQIDYYFSNENLCKDIFLRQNMDEQGWVSISLIASFNIMRKMTSSIQTILDSIQASTVVEVQGDKVRRRNDWMKWLIPRSNQFAAVPGTPSAVPSDHEALVNRMNNVSLNEGASNHADSRSGRSLSGESSSSSREEANDNSVQADHDLSESARMPDKCDATSYAAGH